MSITGQYIIIGIVLAICILLFVKSIRKSVKSKDLCQGCVLKDSCGSASVAKNSQCSAKQYTLQDRQRQ